MKSTFFASIFLLAVSVSVPAQVASHAPVKSQVTAAAPNSAMTVTGKTVARVNGVALTDQDLLREMLAIFPYARVHNGFPKGQEADIRRGALDMIVFEELVYQEAERRHITVSPERIAHGEREFRKQFSSPAEFQAYLKAEARGNIQILRDRIKRALMIESLLKSEVEAKSAISLAELRAYYDKNRAKFMHGEIYSIQTISILPPPNANPEQQREARKRADEAFRLAKATKTFEEFGLVAEKASDDDYRVKMGDHKTVEASQLPPEVVAALKNLKVGQITNLIQLGQNYSIVRMNAHSLAGVKPFEEVKIELREERQKIRYDELRRALAQKLRKNAKVEML
jgi:peptidyl-prolyl cis-trans isomerase SurA